MERARVVVILLPAVAFRHFEGVLVVIRRS
jgi:hypothetical protein